MNKQETMITSVKELVEQIVKAPLKEIDKDKIKAGRKSDLGEDTKLNSSLKSMGMVNPIVVAELSDGSFQLLTGSRRLQCTEQEKVWARVLSVDASTSETIGWLLTTVDSIHSRELSDSEYYSAMKALAVEHGIDESHSFAPMMTLLGIDSEDEKYKNLHRIWKLYQHSGLREVLDNGIASVTTVKSLNVTDDLKNQFVEQLKRVHDRAVQNGNCKKSDELDRATCEDVLKSVQKNKADGKGNGIPPLLDVRIEDGEIEFPGVLINLTNASAEDYSNAIQAVFWMQELQKSLEVFINSQEHSNSADFQGVKAATQDTEYSNLAKLVYACDAYKFVPKQLKLNALRAYKRTTEKEVPSKKTLMNELDENFHALVQELVQSNQGK